jgi:Family of unknown function (DUF6325)
MVVAARVGARGRHLPRRGGEYIVACPARQATLEGNDLGDGAFGTTDGGKTMSDIDVELGPVDYVVVAFPAGQANFSGEMASELRALMDSNTVRVLDLLLVTKYVDGSVEASELRDADDSEVGQLRAAEADLAVLLAESDVEEIGGVLEPGSTAAVLVWENTWAAPFGSAVRRSGGQLVTSGRIPTQAILAAMDADRAAKAEGA